MENKKQEVINYLINQSVKHKCVNAYETMYWYSPDLTKERYNFKFLKIMPSVMPDKPYHFSIWAHFLYKNYFYVMKAFEIDAYEVVVNERVNQLVDEILAEGFSPHKIFADEYEEEHEFEQGQFQVMDVPEELIDLIDEIIKNNWYEIEARKLLKEIGIEIQPRRANLSNDDYENFAF